jgi:hypothetical protein
MDSFTLLPGVEAPPNGLPVYRNVLPPFGKSHDGQKGDNDNFYQGIGFVPFDSWVLDMLEEVD